MFTHARALPIAAHHLSDVFRRLVKASGLPPVRLHDLRHGAASLALQAGADMKVVCDELGQSSIVLTADTYISVLPNLALDAAQRGAELILAHGTRVPGTRRVRRAEPARTVVRPSVWVQAACRSHVCGAEKPWRTTFHPPKRPERDFHPVHIPVRREKQADGPSDAS